MMLDSGNCKLAYKATRLGLGLYLVYMGGIGVFMNLPKFQNSPRIQGSVFWLSWLHTTALDPIVFLLPLAVAVVGVGLLLDIRVKILAMLVTVVCIAFGNFYPALFALGLIVFNQQDITALDSGEVPADEKYAALRWR